MLAGISTPDTYKLAVMGDRCVVEEWVSLRRVHTCLMIFSCLVLIGCGRETVASNNRTTTVAEQVLPRELAAPPKSLDLPRWGGPNPHFFVDNSGGSIRVFSRDPGWNGHDIKVYYAPFADVEVYNGEYALRPHAKLQQIGSSPLKNDGQWQVHWKIGGHRLPRMYYLFVRTDIGQVGIEKIVMQGHRALITGAESPVQ